MQMRVANFFSHYQPQPWQQRRPYAYHALFTGADKKSSDNVAA
jgi:hypothetical protein